MLLERLTGVLGGDGGGRRNGGSTGELSMSPASDTSLSAAGRPNGLQGPVGLSAMSMLSPAGGDPGGLSMAGPPLAGGIASLSANVSPVAWPTVASSSTCRSRARISPRSQDLVCFSISLRIAATTCKHSVASSSITKHWH